MSNLEFIEKEIKVLTKRIKELEEEEDLHWNYEHEDEAIECDFQREEYEDLLKKFQQIKAELEVLQILTKCIRVSIISYDDNDVSKTAYDYSLETDKLTIEEFNTLDNYCKSLGVFDE